MTSKRLLIIGSVLLLLVLVVFLMQRPAEQPSAEPTGTPLPAPTPTDQPAQPGPDLGFIMSVEPAETTTQVGDTFSLEVIIAQVSNLGAFEFNLIYDPAIIQVTGVEIGDFLGSTERNAVPLGPEIDNPAGVTSFAAFSFGPQSGAEGQGTLATVTFEAQAAGTTTVALGDVQVPDTQATVIPALEILSATVTVE